MYANQSPAYPNASGLMEGNMIKPPSMSVTAALIIKLENINTILRDAIICQRSLVERLHGPSPEAAKEAGKCPSPAGALDIIDDRLSWILHSAQEITINQQALDRLA